MIVEKVNELAEAEAFETDTGHSQNLSHPAQAQHQGESQQEQFDERQFAEVLGRAGVDLDDQLVRKPGGRVRLAEKPRLEVADQFIN